MDLEFLKQFGLGSYEMKALAALMKLGKASASQVSAAASIPSSKIYQALANLETLGFLTREEIEGADTFTLLPPGEVITNLQQRRSEQEAILREQLVSLKFELGTSVNSVKKTIPKVEIVKLANWKEQLTKVAIAAESIHAYFNVVDPFSFHIFSYYLELCTTQIDKELPHKVLLYNKSGMLPAGHMRSFPHIEFRLLDASIGQSGVSWDDEHIIWQQGFADVGPLASVYTQDAELAKDFLRQFDQAWFGGRAFERYTSIIN